MAGLNNLISDTQTTSTTMPAWYDASQQKIMEQGNTALSGAPAFNQTVGQNAVNTLQGSNNPFTQSTSALNTIASGAANPWITDASGNVNPNTNTAMGGLFSAQRNELNQLMPEYSAVAEAGGIGSGNFGSLRGQTAVQKARGDAFTKLNAAQMQAALTNQATGATAARYLGDVGTQGIEADINVGKEQMNAPFRSVSNYANLLGSMQVPTTTSSKVQYSPLSQFTALGTAGKGALDSLTALYKTPAGKNMLDKIGIGSLFGSSNTGSGLTPNLNAGTYPLADGGNMVINADGSRVITSKDGTVSNFDKNGEPTADVLSPIPDTGLPDTGGGGNPDNPEPIPDYTGPEIEF
jgi:hypothetical protein